MILSKLLVVFTKSHYKSGHDFVQTHLSGVGFLKKRSMFLLQEIGMINHRACNDKNYLKGSLEEPKRYYIKKHVSKSQFAPFKMECCDCISQDIFRIALERILLMGKKSQIAGICNVSK